jgi:hypothetical protein
MDGILYYKVYCRQVFLRERVDCRTALAADGVQGSPGQDAVAGMEDVAGRRLFSIVMGCISGISLLVGGIGIMNIMPAGPPS